jgi:adenylyltransferase/sulfurtransferase
MRLPSLLVLLVLLLSACGQPAVQQAPARPAAQSAPATPQDITPQELAAELQAADRPFLLDVREPFEVDIASIPGTSQLIPLGQLPDRLNELDTDEEIVIYCRSGNRSQQAARMLRAAGFRNVRNLEGGIIGWSAEVDPSMPTY